LACVRLSLHKNMNTSKIWLIGVWCVTLLGWEQMAFPRPIEFIDSGQALTTGSNAQRAALGDLNGDGTIDAFVVNTADPNIVYFNDGKGVFRKSSQIFKTSYSYAVALGDLDQDGFLDSYIANSGLNKPDTVLLNNGKGEMLDSGQRLGNADTMDVALGDVDGDGYLDAVVANVGKKNEVWFNDGSGHFLSKSPQLLGNESSFGVVLGDVNNDGRLDAVFANYLRPCTVWYNQNGKLIDSGQRIGNAKSAAVALGDLDSDGVLDLFIANRASQPDTVWRNDGNGVFIPTNQCLGNNTNGGCLGTDSTDVVLSDMDEDGDLDVLVATTSKQPDVIWWNYGNAMFYQGPLLGNNDNTGATIADLDGDNDLDVFITSDMDGSVMFKGQGQLIFTLEPNFELSDPELQKLLQNLQTQPIPLFDKTRGNISIKSSIGILRTYYIEPSASVDLEKLRQQFIDLSAVNDCLYNEHILFDQTSEASDDTPANWTPAQINAPSDTWEIKREANGLAIAVLDNFRGFTQANTAQSHGEQVARLADDNGKANLLLVNVASKSNDYATFETLFRAIEFAVDQSIELQDFSKMVINLSLSAPITKLGNTEDERQRNAALFQRWLKYAALSGVPVVASMGNFNWDVPHYPAAFPESLAVGGANVQNRRWLDAATGFGSNTGDHLALLAQAQDASGATSGTSFAAARVTNAAATILSVLSEKYPNLSAEQKAERLRWLLEITALDGSGDPAEDTPGRDPFYGFGMLDAEGAAACASDGGLLARPGAVEFKTVRLGETANMPVRLTNCSMEDTLTISKEQIAIRAEQTQTPEFALLNFFGVMTLKPGESSALNLQFFPKSGGRKTATLHIAASPTISRDVALSGEAVEAQFAGLNAAPEFFNFRDVTIGESAQARLTLTNFLPQTVTLESVSIVEIGANSGFRVLNAPAGQTVNASASIAFDAQFAPTLPGAKFAILRIITAEQPETPFDIPLYGNAVESGQTTENGETPVDPPINPASLLADADRLMQAGQKDYASAEFWNALEKFQQAGKLYALARSRSGEARAFEAAGLTFASVGRLTKSVENFRAAAAIYRDLNDRRREGIVLNYLGAVYAKTNESINALNTYHDVLAIEKELGERLHEGRTMTNIGVTYLNQGLLPDAARYVTQALAIGRETGDIDGIAKATLNLGLIALREKKFVEAINAFKEAIRGLSQLQKAEDEIGMTSLNVGDAYLAQAKYQDAISAYLKALSIFRNIRYSKGEVLALTKIGELYKAEGDLPNALRLFQQARTVCQTSLDLPEEIAIMKRIAELHDAMRQPALQAAALTDLGELQGRMGYVDDAILTLTRVLQLHGAVTSNMDVSTASAVSTLNDPIGLSHAFVVFADVLLDRKEYANTITLIELAQTLQPNPATWSEAGRANILLGEAYLRQGFAAAASRELQAAPDSGRKFLCSAEVLMAQGDNAQASALLLNALQIFDAAASYSEVGESRLDLAEIAVRQGNLAQARNDLRAALLAFRMAGNLEGEAAALLRLGDLDTQPKEALKSYQDAFDLYRELQNQEGQLAALRRMLAAQGDRTDGEKVAQLHLETAKAYLNKGEYDASLTELNAALAALTTPSASLRADILLHLGATYRLQKNYPASLTALEEASAILPAECLLAATVKLNAGETLFRQNLDNGATNFDAALQQYQQALAAYRAIGDLVGQGKTLMRIGDVYLRQERYADAAKCYEEAVALLAQADDHYYQIMALMNLGGAYDALGLYWDALEAYRRALGIMHDTGMFLFSSSFHVMRDMRPITETLTPLSPVNPPQIYRNIAQDYAALGDNAAAEEALQQAEEAEQSPQISEPELAPEPGGKEIEKLEEQLAEQAERGDEVGQEETIKELEQRDPDYAKRSTSRSYSSSSSNDGTSQSSLPKERAQRRAETLNTMGLNYLRQGDPYKAGQALMAAKDIQKTLGDEAGLAVTENNLGLMHYQTGNDERAAEMFAQSLARFRGTNDPAGVANTLNHLALLHLRWGRNFRVQAKWREAEMQYGQASKLFVEAADIAAMLDERGFAMTLSNGIGMTQMELLLLYRRLGDKAQSGDPLLAQAYYLKANEAYQRGMRELQRSLAAAKTLQRRGAQGATLHNLGLLYAAAQLERDALPPLWNALRLELATRNRLDAARTLSELGFLYEREGRASLLFSRNDAKNWRERAIRFAFGALRYEQALYLYKRSLSIQETLFETATLETFKIAAAEEATDAYQQTAMLLMETNRAAEAFAMTERARGRAFLDALGNARQMVRQAVTPEFANQETALRQEADALRHKLDAALEAGSPDAEEMQRQFDAIERRYERLLQEIELTRPEYASFYGVKPLTLQETQALIPDDVTLLSYFVTPKITLAFALTRAKFTAFSLPVSEEGLWQMAHDIKAEPEEKPELASNALRNLYAQFVEPVESALQTETLGIIPHGALHYLPFAAFDAAASDADAPRYFGDQYHLFTLSGGASALRFIAAKSHQSGKQAAVFGVTGNPPLPHVVEEAETIARLYGATPILNESATAAEFVKQAETASIIHVAAHARLDANNPALSSIQFGDRELRLHELYGMNFAQASLVTLSGCETRLGRLSRGDDLVALERAALVAGAPVVAASLWRVDDAATTALMTAFHERLTQGMTPLSAMQQAQQATRQRYPQPYYWAAFALSGWPL